MTPTSAKISTEEAKELMDIRERIIENLRPDLRELEKKEEGLITQSEIDNDLFGVKWHTKNRNYIKSVASKKNCFVFSRDDVSRFFDNPKCTHFLVILAAKDSDLVHENIHKGDQTVILIGCKRKETKQPYISTLNFESLTGTDGEEATQHPNFETIIDMPEDPTDPIDPTDPGNQNATNLPANTLENVPLNFSLRLK